MASFNWLGGAMDSAFSWGGQPDPNNPVVPGPSDFATISLGGTLSGGLSVIQATFNATVDLAGSITTSAFAVVNGGVLTVGAGGSLNGHGLDLFGGQMVQNGGTVTIGAAHEFIADAPGSVAGYTQNGGTHSIAGDLSLGFGGTGTFDLTGGTLSSLAEFIGQNGTGTFTQTGGSHTVTDRIVLGIDQTGGVNGPGTGTYTLGGTGKLSVQTVFIGSDPNCTGTFNFNTAAGDAATLTISGTGGFPGLIVGGQGSGSFTQGHGALNTTIAVGFRSTGDGTLTHKNGTLTSKDEEVGVAGNGTLVQENGTNKVTGNGLILGALAASVGNYNLQGGTLDAVREVVGASGTGTLTQTGGLNKLGGPLVLGASSGADGSYGLQGGTLTTAASIVLGSVANASGHFTISNPAASVTVATGGTLIVGNSGTGTLTQSDGTLTAQLDLAAKGGSSGTATLSGGTLTANGEVVGDLGTATFTQSGGTHEVKTGDLVVGNGAGGDGTFDLHAGSLKVTAGSLTLGAAAGSTGTFSFNAGAGDAATLEITAGTLVVGDGGDGGFTLGGGTLDANLTVAAQSGSNGTFDLVGGTLTSTDGDEVIGSAGTGTFTQKAGTNTIQNGGLFIGDAGGDGTYTLGGSAALSITTGSFSIAGSGGSTGAFLFNTTAGDAATLTIDTKLITVGVHGTGSFIQGGGTVNAKLVVGGQVGAHGTYELDAGTVSARGQTIGNNGTGGFTQNGGTNKITLGGDLLLGALSLGLGTYDLNKGKLSDGGALIGYQGAGSFTQSGGSHTIAGKGSLLDLGVKTGAQGVYTLAAGTLKAVHEVIGDAATGTFTQKGGSNSVAGTGALLEVGVTGTGSYHLNLGSLTATHEVIGQTGTGSFTQKGGVNTLTGGPLVLGALTGGQGSYTLSKGKLIAKTEVVGDAGTGTFTQTGGSNTLATGLTIGRGAGGHGTYDLTGGTLVIKDVAGTSHTLALGLDATATAAMTIASAHATTPFLHLGQATMTVDTGGVLKVLHQVQLDTGSILDVAGGAMLIGGVKTPVADLVAIGSGGTLVGAGTVEGNLREAASGTVMAEGGTLTLTGDLVGGGKLHIADGAVLDLQGNDALGVLFVGAAGQLRLEQTAVITGTIGNLAIGDVIDLAGVTATHAVIKSGKLTVTESDGSTLVLHVAGSLAGNHFVISDDGAGGSALTLEPKLPPVLAADHFAFAPAIHDTALWDLG